jgi:hypothetical protein
MVANPNIKLEKPAHEKTPHRNLVLQSFDLL